MVAAFLFKILFAIPVFHSICYSQECDPNGISCISCTDYQLCSEGSPSGPIFSCENGAGCSEKLLLEHCWMKLNCYALNECSEVGIFPDAMVESNYFVCLPDSGSGFIKYDFTCPEGKFFDKNARVCSARTSTSLETTTIPSSTTSTTPSTITTTPSTTTTTPSTTTTTTTPSTTTTTTPSTTTTTTPSTTTTTTTPSTTTTTTPSTTTTTTTPSTTTTTTPSTTTTTTPSTTTTTTTPSTTTTTTPSTTTTTPSTTTTTEIPSVPFACPAAGIFENPLDCKSYYRCSLSGKAFLYMCPNASYYNELTKRCGLTITPRCRSKLSR